MRNASIAKRSTRLIWSPRFLIVSLVEMKYRLTSWMVESSGMIIFE